jgi:hypothetical protein
MQRYEIRYTDLTDPERPWRHYPQKLATELLLIMKHTQYPGILLNPAFTTEDKPAII